MLVKLLVGMAGCAVVSGLARRKANERKERGMSDYVPTAIESIANGPVLAAEFASATSTVALLSMVALVPVTLPLLILKPGFRKPALITLNIFLASNLAVYVHDKTVKSITSK